MKHMKTSVLRPAVVCSFACILFGQTTPPAQTTALNLLQTREPRMVWNARTLLKADFDYDGVDDYALGAKSASRYVVGIVKGPISEQSKHWTLGFSADPGDQGALCSVSTAAIRLERLDPDEVEETSKLPKNSRGINLFDDACDSFYIFWEVVPESV